MERLLTPPPRVPRASGRAAISPRPPRPLVRHILQIALLAVAAPVALARAQATDTTRHVLTYDDASEVAFLFNGAAALRAEHDTTIMAHDTVSGNVAVLEHSLTVAGTVLGRVVVINGDLTIERDARVDGEVVVTGGTVTIVDSTRVGGGIRTWTDRMRYRREGELVVAITAGESADSGAVNWFRRWRRRHLRTANRFVVRGGTYNRVEGLPVIFGPSIRQNTEIGQLNVAANAIYRSADHFHINGANTGYTAEVSLREGRRRGVAIGASAGDQVLPVESWQLRNSETALTSFFFHRDYRDWYNSTGERVFATLYGERGAQLTLSYGEERWQPRDTRDPFTLFRDGADWRPNPVLDAARFRILDAALHIDTRNNPADPRTGWLVTADLEHGRSNEVVQGPTSPLVRASALFPVRVRYTRLFADIARYNRLSPETQLNARLVIGGRLGGDPLPLERRFSLGGAGSLPGYDFRQRTSGADVLTCNGGVSIPGTPAQCERMILAQLEYRSDFALRLFRRRTREGESRHLVDQPATWLLFTDAGRGWLVGDRAGDERYGTWSLPSLGSFKGDFGAGLDLHWVGVYVAKSISDWSTSPNLVIRLRHRF